MSNLQSKIEDEQALAMQLQKKIKELQVKSMVSTSVMQNDKITNSKELTMSFSSPPGPHRGAGGGDRG